MDEQLPDCAAGLALVCRDIVPWLASFGTLGTIGTVGTVLAIHVFRPGVKLLLAIDVSDRERKSSRVVSETRSAPQVVLSSPDAV